MLGSLYRRSSSTVVRSLGLKSGAFTARGNVINGLRSRLGHNIRQIPGRIGLYDGQQERDNCGVGLVAQLKKVQSRQIVEDANEMLVRMSHRGACGCEANTGDGAGMLVGMPDSFLRAAMAAEGVTLPPLGQYGAGNVFLPKGDAAAIERAKAIFERVARQRGLKVVGFRTVPTDNRDLGKSAVETEPHQEQVFIENAKGLAGPAFERELLRVRKLARAEAREDAALRDLYVCSLSAQTLTYKGQLTPEQVMPYFKGDLAHPDFHSHMALVHSRFSTNTFPSWDRAQPLRMMCHNGEINTLRGNKNWMHARAGIMHSPYYGDETYQLNPICGDHMSDSGNFDATLEVLAKGSERTLPEAVMMMIPEAWQDNPSISPAKRAFYEYNSCVMEPWDGPAMVAFTDGRYVGANLDRNGLRPSRYYVTKDDRVLISSEVGVVPELPDELVAVKHRLEPGKMFLVDFERGELLTDAAVKEELAASRPYQEWVADHLMDLGAWQEAARAQLPPAAGPDFATSTRRLNLFGYSTETLDMLLYPMSVGGKEALGSMGNDAPLAVLSQQPRQVFDYFKQLFAQVTNPPIDPIREEMVMSLMCPVGPEANLLDVGPEHAQRLLVEHPVLTLEQMAAVRDTEYRGWSARTLDATFDLSTGPDGLREALDRLCEEAVKAVAAGRRALVLSDRLAGPGRLPVPSLLAVGAVHQHLLRTQQRTKAALFAEAGDAREVHDFASLLGFGADGICPYVAYEALLKMNRDGLIEAKVRQPVEDEQLVTSYRKAAAKGILKVMSKMGISTLQSYKGAQVFEAVGLNDEVINKCFTGTVSRIQGAGFEALYTDLARLHEAAYPSSAAEPLVPNHGQFHYRHGGEQHLNTPQVMVNLQQSARTNSKEAYAEFSRLIDAQNARVTIRGLLKVKECPQGGVPLEEVEPAKEIVKRFATGAMSLGSISQETHEALAVAMNTLGGRSNTGEGGEDPARFLDNRRSSIKQVASGRFGVTANYLANSDQIQIKMAQGAKPGEGGELPGQKVTEYIGACRGTTPGVGLISPPPHHDIYSIEDLAQLIYDLHQINPAAGVSVKLVSEIGIGTVAAGVAKADADIIQISGHDGGTGASPLSSIKHAGSPWELGLTEVHRTLMQNGLRDRTLLRVDGGIKSGWDVVMGALMGAEEFGFGTIAMVAEGCIMARVCHTNNCPVGITTQKEELRKRFPGTPDHVVNFFQYAAEETRHILAKLGFRRLEDAIGRADLLKQRSTTAAKTADVDLRVLTNMPDVSDRAFLKHGAVKSTGPVLDEDLLKHPAVAKVVADNAGAADVEFDILNTDRSVGGRLAGVLAKKYGNKGFAGEINVTFRGSAGQSFAPFGLPGVNFRLVGEANDYVGKSLHGGGVVIVPPENAGFDPANQSIMGNTCLYGATGGRVFANGRAGERLAVRNSGAQVVVEGTGDHCLEYMTGGVVVSLGAIGRNAGAGMTGGLAYFLDEGDDDAHFMEYINVDTVKVQRLQTAAGEAQLKGLIEEHVAKTGSRKGAQILAEWDSYKGKFWQLYPASQAKKPEVANVEETVVAA
mmetsp:Transcript_22493/g.35526  ORF Transcript_22493/g.35526 Transcript_22493/m.35526 type:complete len:1556 (-) Transcript_22493:190-4857(-)